MQAPMALTGMISVEAMNTVTPELSGWSWQPKFDEPDRLANALLASSQTSQQTYSKQTDHGEGK